MKSKVLVIFVLSFAIFLVGMKEPPKKVEITIYVGMKDLNNKPIPQSEFRSFLKKNVAPQFKGLSVYDSQGYWSDKNGDLQEESSKIIKIIADENLETTKKIDEICNNAITALNQYAISYTILPTNYQRITR